MERSAKGRHLWTCLSTEFTRGDNGDGDGGDGDDDDGGDGDGGDFDDGGDDVSDGEP